MSIACSHSCSPHRATSLCSVRCTYCTRWLVHNSNLNCLLSLFCLYPSIVCPPPYPTLLSSLGLLLNSSTIYLQYSYLFPSSILVLMSSGCGRCGVQSFSFTAASPAGCSHSAPNASLEYWINPRTTSVLPDQQHYYYLAITLHGVSGLRQDGWA